MDALAALKACSNSRDLQMGKMIHKALAENGEDSNSYVANSLIHMYARCGRMSEACKVFNRMRRHDVVSWNALIFGYADNGEGLTALSLFSLMLEAHQPPSALTLVAALKACIAVKGRKTGTCREWGMIVHSFAVTRNLLSDMRVSSTLVDMYAKCGSLLDARFVFAGMSLRDVVSWNALLFGHADAGESETAIQLFWGMQREGCAPNALTFVAALKACSRLKVGALELGLEMHHRALMHGCLSDSRVANTLLDMYTKCGSLMDAHRVFEETRHRNVVSWTVLILGYVENGDETMALKLFSRMKREGFEPDRPVYMAVLRACGCLAIKEAQQVEGKVVKAASLLRGAAIHSEIASSSCSSDVHVASSLIDMYGKCGSMSNAQKVFDEIVHQDVVLWTALILGYADNGEGHKALEIYSRMTCAPDALTFVAVVKACTVLGALDIGRNLHVEICCGGFHRDEVLATCLIDFYGKCGSMREAQRAFDCLPTKNVITWTALMSGYSQNGDPDKVFELYNGMLDAGVRPCAVTFLCILTACSHSGLVHKGWEYLKVMATKHRLDPDIEHYHCMLSILGRANELGGAVALVERMPFEPNAVTWTIVLSACRKWGNVELGRFAFESLLRIEDDCATGAACALMANIFGTKSAAADHILGVENSASKMIG